MYNCQVHDYCPHTDQHIIVECTSMNDRVMPNGYIIANRCTAFLERTMNDSTILHIHFISHPDEIYITTDNGVEPETAIIPCNYISDNGGVGSNIAVGAKGGEFVFDWKYNRHNLNLR